MAEREEKRVVQLQGDDRARATRLHEEISGRLVELSLITSRTLGKETPALSHLKFEQRFRTDDDPSHPRSVFIKVVQLDLKGNCVSVYEDPPGLSRTCEAGD
jgi:hypothetical protein